MPFLRLETSTPTETDKVIAAQQKKIEELTEQVKQLRYVDQDVAVFLKDAGNKLDEKLEKIDKFEKSLKTKYPKIYKQFEESN